MLENFLFKNMPPPTHIFYIIHHAQLRAYCRFAKKMKLFSWLIIFSDIFLCRSPWHSVRALLCQSHAVNVDNYRSASAKPALATHPLKLMPFTTESLANSQFMETVISPNSALVSFSLTREPDTWCLISGRPRKNSREALREIFGYSEFCRGFYTCQSRRASKQKKVQNICDLQEASSELLPSRHSLTTAGMFSGFNSFCLFVWAQAN